MGTLGVALVFTGGLLLYWTWRSPVKKTPTALPLDPMKPLAPNVQPPGVPVFPVLPQPGQSGRA